MFKKLKLNIFFKEALFFVLTHILGLLIIFRINQVPEIKQTLETQAPPFSPWRFLFNFFVITVIFFLLLPLFKKRPILLKAFFFLSIFVGLDVVIGIFLGEPYALAVSLILVILLGAYPRVLFHNIAFSVALAGVGSIIALSLNPEAIVIILAILAFYDVMAVYLTKHMIKMARLPAQKGVFFGLIVPKESRDFLKDKPTLEFGKERTFFFLGGGDIVLPLVLVVSVAKNNFYQGLIIALFALLGLFLMHLIFVLYRKRKPMAGLPPLVFMTLLGYLIVVLL